MSKKVMILCGSANKDGVTAKMCRSAENTLGSRGYDVAVFYLGDMKIGHCKDCGQCSSGKCIIDDDMSQIYSSFTESDYLILATPIHFSGPSSLIKTAMDRFQPIWYDKGNHPHTCIGMLCGGSDNPEFEVTEKIFKAFCITCEMTYFGSLKIPATDKNGANNVDKTVEYFFSFFIPGKA